MKNFALNLFKVKRKNTEKTSLVSTKRSYTLEKKLHLSMELLLEPVTSFWCFSCNFKHIQRKIFHTDVMLLILTFEYLLRICLLWKLKWWFRTTYLINNFETYEHFKWKQKIYLRPSWARLSLQTRYFPRVLHVHSF